MPTNNHLNAACLQMCSTDSIDKNIKKIESLFANADMQHIDLIVLPENATLITNSTELKHQAAQKQAYQKVFDVFSHLSKQYQTWIVAGSLLIQDMYHEDKFLNHCPVFTPQGKRVGAYNKIHLFDVDLPTESWKESQSITPGSKAAIVDLGSAWKLGLSICYDLRFPELYRKYNKHQCNILSVPAAFTTPTGKAHWEILLKARAIENQAYVLASGQQGKHVDGRETYGHSMIINPWGETLAEIKEGEGIITASLDMSFLNDLKKRMPVLDHRRI